MRARPTWVLLICSLAGFALAGAMQGPLLAQRRAYQLDLADPLENTTPLVAFTTVALGGFRGVLADLLWLRISKLQEEGRFFEIVQLSDWITKLEPRFAPVWAFHAWNMAYNISVISQDPATRWRWVLHGIELLRDDGLKYNPGSSSLFWELSWLFMHKLGAQFDTAYPYYRRAWARATSDVFPGGRPDPGRAKELHDRFKMDLDVIRALEDRYGVLDWRLPHTHALYWAWRGRAHAKGFDRVSLDRVIYHSLDSLVLSGTLHFDPEQDVYETSPDWQLLDAALRNHEEVDKSYPDVESMKVSYANFLITVIPGLRDAGRDAEADRLIERLKELSPEDYEHYFGP